MVVLHNPLPETTSALLVGEVPDTLPRSVPWWEDYDDYLPILLGLSIPLIEPPLPARRMRDRAGEGHPGRSGARTGLSQR